MVKRRWAKMAFWSLFATVVVTLALLLTAARLLFPHVDEYQQEIEAWASEVLGQSLTIGELDARWRYTYPEIILRQVNLLDSQGDTLNTLPELSLSLDVSQLLYSQQIAFVHLGISLDKLTLQRDLQGQISALEFQTPVSDSQDDSDSADLILGWLLEQGDLRINIAELVWIDQGSVLEYHFHDANFSLNNDADHHQLSGMIQLPFSMGASLELAAEVIGNPLQDNDWQGTVYLSGEDISLPHWLLEQSIYDQQVTDGTLDFSLWSEWQDSQLQGMQGEASLYGLELSSTASAGSRHFEYLRTDVDWQRTANSWQLALNDFALSYQQRIWPRNSHVFRSTFADEQAIAWQSGYLHIANIDDFITYLGVLSPEQQQMLAALKPQGELHDIDVQYSEADQYSVIAELQNISLLPLDGMPGIKNVSAHLIAQPTQGELQLKSENGEFDWPTVFRDQLPIKQLHGHFAWQQQGDEWLLNSRGFSLSNQHLSVDGAINLSLPTNKSPFLDLALDFKRADMANTSRYLPTPLLSDAVIAWLDQGIVRGEVVSGGMIYHGALQAFPFRGGEGQFDVDLNVTEATIVPDEGWLPISDIDASVRFSGAGMVIDAKRGQLLNSKIQHCRVAIDDMEAESSYLSISGDVAANTPDIFDYLLRSPVADAVDFLTMFRAKGKSDINLALEIPLSEKGEFSFNAFGELSKNSLDILPADLSVDELSGTLHISTAGLEIERINGLLYGQPIEVSAKTLHEVPGGATELLVESHISGDMLNQYLDIPLFSNLMLGEGLLTGHVFIPHQPSLALRVPSVQLSSSLHGVSMALPSTLAKVADESRTLSVNLQFPQDLPPLMKIDYQDQLSALIRFDKPRLRGRVQIGEGDIQLPEESGLVIAGELDAFSLTELLALLPESEGMGSVEPSFVSRVNLNLNKLELFGQHLESAQLNATQMSRQWFINVDSPQAKGRLQLSEQLFDDPIVAEMEYLHLNKLPDSDLSDSTDEASSFDMTMLPPMQLQVQQFSYDELSLGALKLSSGWVGSNYHLDELLLHPHSAALKLQGKWFSNPSQQGKSRLNIELKSENIGRTISGLGFAGTIKNGDGRVNGAIQWDGGIGEFDAVNLNGKIDFKLEEGRILDVEPGAGRILGLLSIQMLPRRLLLDFGDLFASGFSFDEIRGHYDLSAGVATTDNFTMLGSSARIDMLGAVDLGQQRYDQRLIITPFVTESLPMLTYLTGVATPQIAAIMFLAQKVFQDDLEKIAQFEYHVGGPWDNPEIVKVGEERAGG